MSADNWLSGGSPGRLTGVGDRGRQADKGAGRGRQPWHGPGAFAEAEGRGHPSVPVGQYCRYRAPDHGPPPHLILGPRAPDREPRKQMDMSNVRRTGKQPYESVRKQFEEIGDRVISRHWEDGAPVRQGYRRFLGAMDELAGRLLDDDEIAQRGQDLLRDEEAAGTAESGQADDAERAGGADQSAGADGASGAEGSAGADGSAGAGAGSAEAADAAGDSVWTQATDE